MADQAPFASKSASGLPEGYSIDLCNSLVGTISATVGELRPEYVETTLSEVFDAVAEGRLDLACSAITITLARRELVDFSEPIFVTGASAILRKDSPRDVRELFLGERTVSPPRSLELRPFARSRLGTRGTTTESALRQAVSTGKYTADVATFATHADGLRALQDRDIDAYVADRVLLAGMLVGSGNPPGILLADRRLTNEFYGIAMKRGDSDFRLLIDRFLSRFYAEPEFSALLTKHFGAYAAAVWEQIQSQAILE